MPASGQDTGFNVIGRLLFEEPYAAAGPSQYLRCRNTEQNMVGESAVYPLPPAARVAADAHGCARGGRGRGVRGYVRTSGGPASSPTARAPRRLAARCPASDTWRRGSAPARRSSLVARRSVAPSLLTASPRLPCLTDGNRFHSARNGQAEVLHTRRSALCRRVAHCSLSIPYAIQPITVSWARLSHGTPPPPHQKHTSADCNSEAGGASGGGMRVHPARLPSDPLGL